MLWQRHVPDSTDTEAVLHRDQAGPFLKTENHVQLREVTIQGRGWLLPEFRYPHRVQMRDEVMVQRWGWPLIELYSNGVELKEKIIAQDEAGSFSKYHLWKERRKDRDRTKSHGSGWVGEIWKEKLSMDKLDKYAMSLNGNHATISRYD